VTHFVIKKTIKMNEKRKILVLKNYNYYITSEYRLLTYSPMFLDDEKTCFWMAKRQIFLDCNKKRGFF